MKVNTAIAPQLIINSENQKGTIFYFLLKSKYRTSVFYNYSPEKLSQCTGVSINTVRKYIGFLKRNDYASITNGNLWLRSSRKVSNRERLISIDTRPWTTWRQFENRVYAAIIKLNIMQQSFHYEGKRISAGKSIKENRVRKYKKYIRRYGKPTKESAELQIVNSVRQVACLFNRSKSWAQRRLILLQEMGYVKLSHQIESVPNVCHPDCIDGYAYYNKWKKSISIHHGTQINVKY